jgi:hypothetical protein
VGDGQDCKQLLTLVTSEIVRAYSHELQSFQIPSTALASANSTPKNIVSSCSELANLNPPTADIHAWSAKMDEPHCETGI